MSNKFYAVKVGRVPGVYMTWDECRRQVESYKGAIYKSFHKREEADAWLAQSPAKPKLSRDVQVYTDGSYRNGTISWAFVVYENNEEIHSDSGVIDAPGEISKSYNIVGELSAVMRAVDWLANARPFSTATIYHDYAGVSLHLTGEWKAKQPASVRYLDWMKSRDLTGIDFSKVAGHSGNVGNDRADELAKAALNEKRGD